MRLCIKVMRMPWKPRWKPVSVLTGFLGSGKTTVLQHLLTLPGMKRTALIINEFGEVPVDHLLVENAEEKMVLLSNGCVCCSVRGDLVTAVRSLFTRMQADEIPPFERILLETTGLADPGPIVQSLIGPALAHYPVYFDSIATTVDAQHGINAMSEHNQIVSQIAVADSVMITKCDLATKDSIAHTREQIRKLNPRARIEEITNGIADKDLVFGQCLLDPTSSHKEMRDSIATRRTKELSASTAASENTGPGISRHQGIQSFVIRRDEPISYAVLDQFLRSLQGYKGSNLLRIKGLVYLRDKPQRPTVIHGVQGQMHPPTTLKRWPTPVRRTELVFITKDISYDDVNNLLSGVAGGFR